MRKRIPLFAIAAVLSAVLVVWVGSSTAGASSSSAAIQVPRAGTGSPQTGEFTPSGESDVTQAEFPGQTEEEGGPGPFPGTIVDRSNSTGVGNGVSVSSGQKAKSSPQVNTSFQGLNHYQQRYSRGGNQFSIEPPDQGLCVGNGYELEVLNDVLNVFNASGQSVLPDNTATNIVGGFPRNVNHAVDLNSFYGYAPAVNRTTGVRGPFVTDPSCLYDAATQRWFLVSLTLEVKPTAPNAGGFLGPNHLDIAVSNTSSPTGSWTIYRLPVQDDGTEGTPDHGCTHTGTPPAYRTNPNACLGDYPHIGADANGFYITTNEYEFFGNAFIGAQVYAFSKAQLAATPASIAVTQIDTSQSAPGGKPGFTLWPAQSPGTGSFNTANGGTENFLSSNAADEAQCDSGTVCKGTGSSDDLLVWSLANTSSLNTASPALSLTDTVLTVGQYGIPPKQKQPGSGTLATTATPQGYCINDVTTVTIAGVGCWKLLFNPPEPAHDEVISRPDSNDTRMQQVMFANGKLWGALDTALNPGGGAQRAGIEWFIVNPNSGKLVLQGYLGASGHDFTYPAIGVTASGRGVMAFTDTGDNTYPSAAYAPIDALVGAGAWSDIASGATQDDGFTSYKSQVGNPPRTRWGDYGAAAVDGNSIWIASEYIAGSCGYTDWGGPFFVGGTGDNLLGTCGGANHGPGPRTALANWSTRISKLTP